MRRFAEVVMRRFAEVVMRRFAGLFLTEQLEGTVP